jgi:hypothetical protein
MNVTTIKENEDGSANVVFDLTPEEVDALVRYGILEALKAAIREGEKLKVDGADVDELNGASDE